MVRFLYNIFIFQTIYVKSLCLRVFPNSLKYSECTLHPVNLLDYESVCHTNFRDLGILEYSHLHIGILICKEEGNTVTLGVA